MTDQELRAKLADEVLDAPWAELAPHFARDALLVAGPDVDLLDVAVAMARDDVGRIQGWLTSASLGRPGREAAEAWGQAPPRFQAVIVQPWVLAQVIGAPSAEG